ncbi:MAG: hypothetical protein SF053_19665 [Bacteroidia bacterium]|nr:hypothetical protein [Bacteroidia bacterium]
MHTVQTFQTRAWVALWGALAFFVFSGLAAQVPVPDPVRGLVYPATLVRTLTERWVYLEADLMLGAILRLLVVFGCIWLAGFAMLNIGHGLLKGHDGYGA